MRFLKSKTIVFLMVMVMGIMMFTAGCSGNGSSEDPGDDPGIPAPEEIDFIVDKMTTEEKIAQMLIPALRFQGDREEPDGVFEMNDKLESIIAKYPFGGIIFFNENIENPSQTTKLINDMQAVNRDAGFDTGLFIAIDQEGGAVTRLGAGTQMPGNMTLGAIGDAGFVRAAAGVIGSELRVQGFNMNFAPDIDVNNNPGNPIIGIRSFSDDPEVVGEFGKIFAEELRNYNIIPALKHFPGHGDTDTDSHTGLPCINKTLDEIRSLELIPFQAVAADAEMIMTAHIQYPEIEKETYKSKKTGKDISLPATLSKTIITDILRGELGYYGVVISDALDMGAIADHFDRLDAAKLAINAGVDMLLKPLTAHIEDAGKELDEYIKGIAGLVESGDIPEERIDESVRRIVELKIKYGILSAEITDLDESEAAKEVGSKLNHDIEWEAALAGVTLVKDENNGAEPLVPEKSKVTIAVPYNSEMNSITYAKQKLLEDGVINAEDSITSICYGDVAAWDVNSIADEANVIIGISAMYGLSELNPTIEEGVLTDFLQRLIEAAHSKGKKCIIISAELPYDVAAFQEADALLICYGARGMAELPGDFTGVTREYGPNVPAAIYAAFSGDHSGKLPVDIPKLKDDYTYSDEILYEKGFGL